MLAAVRPAIAATSANIGIENGHTPVAFTWQSLNQFTLTLSDRLDSAELARVSRANRCDDPHRRPSNRTQVGDVSKTSSPQLQDQNLRVFGGSGEGQRHPNLVVERTFAGVGPASGPQGSRKEILCRGLAHRPGNRNDVSPVKTAASSTPQRGKRNCCVIDSNHQPTRGLNIGAGKRRYRSSGKRRINKVVTISLREHGHKQRTGVIGYLPGILGDPFDYNIWTLCVAAHGANKLVSGPTHLWSVTRVRSQGGRSRRN